MTQRRLLLRRYEVLLGGRCLLKTGRLPRLLRPEPVRREINDQTTPTSSDAVDESPPLSTTGKMC